MGDDLTTVSRFEALAFSRHLTETYTPCGVDSRLKAIKALYNWAFAEELVTENPFRRITVTIPDDPRPTASDEQIEAMLRSARRNRRDFALITLLVETGARKGEVAAVTMADVDLSSGMVTFRESKSRPRTVPLSDRAVTALARWLQYRGVGSGSLWSCPWPSGGQSVPAGQGGGEAPLRGNVVAARLTPPVCRQLAVEGGSEVSLMRLCGWSSREMIALYSRDSADLIAADEFKRLMG